MGSVIDRRLRLMRAGPSRLLYDTFTGADGTLLTAHPMDVGPGWTAVNSTPTIQVGRAVAANTSNGRPNVVSDAGSADATVRATCRLVTAPGQAGLVWRYVDSGNYWQLSGYGGDGKIYLYQYQSGSPTNPGSWPAGIVTGVDFLLAVDVRGSTFRFFVNGTQIATFSSTAYQSATKYGLVSWETDNTWDDFEVTP